MQTTISLRRGRPAATALAVLIAGLAIGLPAAARASCTSYTHTTRSFEAGSLIVPMDTTYQQTLGLREAYGLVWHLLRHGVRVAWILDSTKTTITAVDFSISGSPAVERLARSGSYDAFSGSGVPLGSIDYAGAPFVIPAEDADAALQLIHHGTLPQDTSVQFGWSLVSTFNSVVVHRAKAAFTAPVLRMTDHPPKKIALFGDAGWMGTILGLCHLDFSGAGGTPSSPGIFYDRFTKTELASTTLDPNVYQMLWVNGDARGVLSSAAHDNVAAFVNAGSGVVASGDAIREMECYGCTNQDCTAGVCSPHTRFQTSDGISSYTGHGTHRDPLHPASPFSQVGGLEYHGLSDELQAFEPIGGSGWDGPGPPGWNSCSYPLVRNGNGQVLISMLDEVGKGPVFYITGRNYDTGTSDMNIAMQRTVVSWAFLGGYGVQQAKPTAYQVELTRSSPLVVEREGPPAEVVSFQGSYVWPPSMQPEFDPSNPTAWQFPATAGHLRAYDMSTMTSGTMLDFDNLGTFEKWDAANTIPALTSRHVYSTLTTSGTATRVDFSGYVSATSVPSAIQAAVNQSTSQAAKDLITGVVGGGLGGIDTSTPAFIGAPKLVSFSSYDRPAVIYVGAMDGMLHAFKVRDIEANAVPWSDATELWAYIPSDQLGLLASNRAAVQSSPTVADVHGDFLLSTGAPGQDGSGENITLLTLASGETRIHSGTTCTTDIQCAFHERCVSGKCQTRAAIHAIDVSNPDPASTACPKGFANCVTGPNVLWVTSPSGMGGASGTAIGVAKVSGALKPYVYAATQDGTATTSIGGARLYALNAEDGAVLWTRTISYTKTIPIQGVAPNEIPPTPALVDKAGDTGYQTHLYFGDLQGRLWEIDAGDGTPTGNAPIWNAASAFSDSSASCNYPIASAVALYRDQQTHLHVVLVTGGVHWAPSDSTYRQKLVDIDVTASPVVAKVLQTFAAGERVYGAPVVSNHDVYITASTGLVDQLQWDQSYSGSTFRVNVSDITSPVITTLAITDMSGSTVGLSNTGNVVTTSTRSTGIHYNRGADTTATNPQSEHAGSQSSRVRLWMPTLGK